MTLQGFCAAAGAVLVASTAALPAPAPVVPFTVSRNKVLVPVQVNGSRPLRLILDSGMGFEGALLFRSGLKDSLGTDRLFEAVIPGAGGGPPSPAFVADSLSLQVGGVSFENQRVILLADTTMARGVSDGVIGYTLLGRHAVELDYDRLVLTLHDPRAFEPGDGWTALPLTLNDRNWPFLEVRVAVGSEEPQPLEVYIDCASSETIELLTRSGMKFPLPDRTVEVVLGRGLSGDIHGRRGAISTLAIGPHVLTDLEAAFVPAEIRSKAEGADAVLSNGALSRFNVVFDYANARLLIRPNRRVPEGPG